MKVIAFNGSARKNGNTTALLNIVLEEIRARGGETELIELAGINLSGCTACYQCFETKDGRCAVDDDLINEAIDKMRG
ncbi:MAG: flavodoxin family protein, partial [Desulfurivibrionaceae bacterium]